MSPNIGETSSTLDTPRTQVMRFGAVATTHTGVFPWQTDGGTRDVALENAVVDATNQHRASIGVQIVKHDVGGCLEYNVVGKCYDMAKWMYLQHDQPARGPFQASTIGDRFVESGYSTNAAWGENLAYGLQTAQDVLTAWLSDIGHRQNVEGSSWSWMGVGAVKASNGLYFIGQDFGTEHDPTGGSPPPPPPPPSMSDFDSWMKTEYPLLIKSPPYKGWVRNNPGEAAKFEQYLKDPTGTMAMTTAFGKFLVGTVQLLAT